MADAWDLVAEMRIQKAVENGELSNLASEGQAVEVTEDFSIPWTVRWLLRKPINSKDVSGGQFEAKAIAVRVLKGQLRRAQINEMIRQARKAKAVK